MKPRGKSAGQTVALCGALLALALILSYVEALVPFLVAVPGIKMGLANVVAVFALYRLRWPAAWGISLLRVVLVAMLFGHFMTLAYSISGAVASLLVMMALKKNGKFGCAGVSIGGGVAHNLGQILCAVWLLGTRQILYYVPVLLVTGTAAGLVIGLLAGLVLVRLKEA